MEKDVLELDENEMKSLENNNWLDANAVIKLLQHYNPDRTVLDHCTTSETFYKRISDLEIYSDGRFLIPLAINSIDKSFMAANHYVGLLIKKFMGKVVEVIYIDPMGHKPNKIIIDTLNQIKVAFYNGNLQYAVIEANKVSFKEGHNTDDCGAILVYLMTLAAHDEPLPNLLLAAKTESEAITMSKSIGLSLREIFIRENGIEYESDNSIDILNLSYLDILSVTNKKNLRIDKMKQQQFAETLLAIKDSIESGNGISREYLEETDPEKGYRLYFQKEHLIKSTFVFLSKFILDDSKTGRILNDFILEHPDVKFALRYYDPIEEFDYWAKTIEKVILTLIKFSIPALYNHHTMYTQLVFNIDGFRIVFHSHELVKIAKEIVEDKFATVPEQNEEDVIASFTVEDEVSSDEEEEKVIIPFKGLFSQTISQNFYKRSPFQITRFDDLLILPLHIQGLDTIYKWLYTTKEYSKRFYKKTDLSIGWWVKLGDRLLLIKNIPENPLYISDHGHARDIIYKVKELALDFPWDKQKCQEMIMALHKILSEKSEAEKVALMRQVASSSFNEIRSWHPDSISNGELEDSIQKTKDDPESALRDFITSNEYILYNLVTRFKSITSFPSFRLEIPSKFFLFNTQTMTKISEDIIIDGISYTIEERFKKLEDFVKRLVLLKIAEEINEGQHKPLFRPVLSFGSADEGEPYRVFAEYIDRYMRTHTASNAELSIYMREILQGGAIKDQLVHDALAFLPNLVAMWFIGEPARNKVCMITGLMLLDMLENDVVLLSLDNTNLYDLKYTCVHPNKPAETSIENRGKGVMILDLYGNILRLNEFDGNHPAAHYLSGSYSTGGHLATQLNTGTLLSPVRQKEGSIIIHWLYNVLQEHFQQMQLVNAIEETLVIPDYSGEKSISGIDHSDTRCLKIKKEILEGKAKGYDMSQKETTLSKLIKIRIQKNIIEHLLKFRLDNLDNLLDLNEEQSAALKAIIKSTTLNDAFSLSLSDDSDYESSHLVRFEKTLKVTNFIHRDIKFDKENLITTEIPIILFSERSHNHHKYNIESIIQIIDDDFNTNTVICIERKQYGKNFGIPDVIALAQLLENSIENNINSLSPLLQQHLPIYYDALLYNIAKAKGIPVVGIEGKGIAYSKESTHYHQAREEYMVEQLVDIVKSGKNAIFLVGAAHINNLIKLLAEQNFRLENSDFSLEQNLITLKFDRDISTEKLVLSEVSTELVKITNFEHKVETNSHPKTEKFVCQEAHFYSFFSYINEFTEQLDLNWQFQKLVHLVDLWKFLFIKEKYRISASFDIFRESDSNFRKLVLLKLHPDKNLGKQESNEDFIFITSLREELSKPFDIQKYVNEKIQAVQPFIYKTNIGFKVFDTVIDTTRLIGVPTIDNAKKVLIDTTYLYSMYSGVNGFSVIINGVDIGYKVYQGEYGQALTQGLTTASYMLIPVAISFVAIPYVGFMYGATLAIHSGYSAINNAYSLYQEYNSVERQLKSGIAYKDISEFLANSPLQRIHDFVDKSRYYEVKINAISLKIEKAQIKQKLEIKGEFGSKLYDYIYMPMLEEKYTLLNKVANGELTKEQAGVLKAKHVAITIEEQSYEHCMEVVKLQVIKMDHYYCYNEEQQILDHVLIGENGRYIEILERL